jgi:hypothetical protein
MQDHISLTQVLLTWHGFSPKPLVMLFNKRICFINKPNVILSCNCAYANNILVCILVPLRGLLIPTLLLCYHSTAKFVIHLPVMFWCVAPLLGACSAGKLTLVTLHMLKSPLEIEYMNGIYRTRSSDVPCVALRSTVLVAQRSRRCRNYLTAERLKPVCIMCKGFSPCVVENTLRFH